MNPKADGANRFLLLLLGLILLAGGVVGLLVGFGVFGSSLADDPVLWPGLQEFVAGNDNWFWPVVAVAAVLLGLLALRWLMAQLGTDRVGSLTLESDPRHGLTTVRASAVTDAVEDEIGSYRGVTSSSARLIGDADQQQLVVVVGINERANIGSLRPRIEDQAVAHVRRALGRTDLPVDLQLKLARPRARLLR